MTEKEQKLKEVENWNKSELDKICDTEENKDEFKVLEEIKILVYEREEKLYKINKWYYSEFMKLQKK